MITAARIASKFAFAHDVPGHHARCVPEEALEEIRFDGQSCMKVFVTNMIADPLHCMTELGFVCCQIQAENTPKQDELTNNTLDFKKRSSYNSYGIIDIYL